MVEPSCLRNKIGAPPHRNTLVFFSQSYKLLCFFLSRDIYRRLELLALLGRLAMLRQQSASKVRFLCELRTTRVRMKTFVAEMGVPLLPVPGPNVIPVIT